MLDIKIERTTTPKEKPADETKLGFGHIFTDHMFVMNYDAGQGWHDARIVPYGDLSLSPAAMCLHYGQEIFEGLKAYRTADGSVQLFRPQENFKRMNNSAERMVIPKINVKRFGDMFPSTNAKIGNSYRAVLSCGDGLFAVNER